MGRHFGDSAAKILTTSSSGVGIIERISNALEAAGVEFFNSSEPGVRLRKQK